MKKLQFILIFAALIFAGVSANAQAFGVKAGGTFSKIAYNPEYFADDLKFKPGVQFGVVLSVPIAPFFDIQPEVVVFQKGVKYKGEVLGVESISKTDVFYVDVPINLKITIPVVPIYVIGGPYVGYAIQGTSYSKLGSISSENEITFDSDGFRQFDFGIDAGIGFMKDFGPIHFFVEGRYNLGIADLSGSDNLVAKNSNIGVFAGILLGKK